MTEWHVYPLVYRPNDPRSDSNGMVPKMLATPGERGAAPMVISDLAEYRAAGVDKQTGKRPMIGGRAQHREFLKRNGYVELGNDYVPPRKEVLTREDRVRDIKRALNE